MHVRSAAAGEPYFGCVPVTLTTFREIERPWSGAPGSSPPSPTNRRRVRYVAGAEQPDVHAYLADLFPTARSETAPGGARAGTPDGDGRRRPAHRLGLPRSTRSSSATA